MIATLGGLVICLVAAVAMAVSATPASAAPSDVPLVGSPVTNHDALTVTSDADHTYVGGVFSSAGPPIGKAMLINTVGTGQPIVDDFPEIIGNSVTEVAPDGSGGWYIAGDFTHVDGEARNGLAHVLADGTVNPNWNPNPTGDVLAIAVAGSDVFVGGSFTAISGQNRVRLAKLSAATGAVDLTWAPLPANNTVRELLVSGTTLYVAGDFAFLAGANLGGLGRLSTTGTGTVDALWNPNFLGAEIRAMVMAGGGLIVGGAFESIGGVQRNRLAKISLTGSGSIDILWNPGADGTVNVLGVLGSNVYVGGWFNQLGGQWRNHVAKVSADGAGAVDPDWAVSVSMDSVVALQVTSDGLFVSGHLSGQGGPFPRLWKIDPAGHGARDDSWSPSPNGFVLAIGVDGGKLLAGGTFTSAGAGNFPRTQAFRYDADGEIDPAWNPNLNTSFGGGVAVRAIAVDSNYIYVGGRFTVVSNPFYNERNNVARYLKSSGELDPTWNPNANGEVWDIELHDGAVYLGGDFTTVGGQQRRGIAKVSAAGTGAVDATWNPDLTLSGNPGVVRSMSAFGSSLFIGGGFTAVGSQPRNNVAKLSSKGAGAADSAWIANANIGVFAVEVAGGDVYVGGQFFNIGGQPRGMVAKLSAAGAGTVDPLWNPDADQAVWGLAVAGSSVYLGGSFASVGGDPRAGVARVAAGGSGAVDAAWNPGTDGNVLAVGLSGDQLVLGGDFREVGGYEHRGIARFELNLPAAPTIDSVSPVSPVNDNQPWVAGTAPENTTVRVYADSECRGVALATGAAGDFLSPGFQVTVADNTSTRFYATATDGVDGTSQCSAGSTVYVEDSAGPKTTFKKAPKGKVKGKKGKKAVFKLKANEVGSTFQCRLTGKKVKKKFTKWKSCKATVKYKKLKPGKKKFQVRATDPLGNVGKPAKRAWKVVK